MSCCAVLPARASARETAAVAILQAPNATSQLQSARAGEPEQASSQWLPDKQARHPEGRPGTMATSPTQHLAKSSAATAHSSRSSRSSQALCGGLADALAASAHAQAACCRSRQAPRQLQAGATAASGSQAALRGTLQRAPTVLSSWPLLPSGEASSAQRDPPCQAQQHSCALRAPSGHVSGLLPLADAGLRVVVVRPALAIVHL